MFPSLSGSNWQINLLGLFWLSLCLCVSAVKISSQGLPVAKPESVGMNVEKLAQIDGLVNADIADKKLPGAVVLIGHKGKIVFRKAYGNRSLLPTVEPMTVDTIFDLASLTKPIATATSIMILVEQGKLRLSDTVGKFIPDIDDENAKKVTIQQLLTHTSGYRPDFDLGEKWTGRDGMLAALKKEKLRSPPGTKFVYSDIGFIVLGEIVERIYEQIQKSNESRGLLDFFDENLSGPLGINAFFVNWRIRPDLMLHSGMSIYAPTETGRAQQNYLGSKYEGSIFDSDVEYGDVFLRGTVHDPTAFRMLGIAGHAGLFSTADDLARFCQMLLNGGVVPAPQGRNLSGSEGAQRRRGSTSRTFPTGRVSASAVRRILSAQTIAKMTAPYVISETGETRGLGWDMNTSFSQNRGELFPLGSFGHTGFTGTGVWIDTVSQTFVVFLSNRVHPDGKGDVAALRAKVSTVVASAIEDTPIEKYREFEAQYHASVAAQIPKFKENLARQTPAENISTGVPQPLPNTGFVPSIQPGVVSVPAAAGSFKADQVLNGIDILEREKYKQLDGLKIGLVTNHTGRNLAGRQTIDILNEAKNLKLVALFAPEHGIRGLLDDKVSDSVDEKTGLPIYSLYGETRRPKPEQLKDLDAIVYDIQDIGTRFYTYTATLKNVSEEAAKARKPVFVLDRPNPLGGIAVEGPLADESQLSFIAAHTTSVRYGLTIGELGMMMNAERKIGADLRVIKMEGWSRSMWFDETGQTWVNPSPNMRSLTEATLYPGIGLLETTNLSVGRGTDTPFEIIGAPWLDGQKLAKYLNERNIKGVRFVPVRFKPAASVFKDEQCGGINIIITDRSAFNSVQTGFEIAAALRKLYPNDWQVEKYGRLLVNNEILEMVKRADSPEDIEKAINAKASEFIKRRASYLLYK